MEENNNYGCDLDVESDSCELKTDHISSDEDMDGKAEDDIKTDFKALRMMKKDEEAAKLPDIEWLNELSEDNDSDGDLVGETADEKDVTFAETARMFKLRRNLDQLDDVQKQKECSLLKARKSLNLLRQRIGSLQEQRDVLEREIEHPEAEDDNISLRRLRAEHKNLCYELQREEEIEAHTDNELRQQELELSEMELEIGKFSFLRQEVQEEEEVFKVLKAQKAVKRLQQERKNHQTLQLKSLRPNTKQTDIVEKAKTLSQKKIIKSHTDHNIAAEYLKKTIKRLRQQEAVKEQQRKEAMEKRIQAVKQLKANIEANQENLRVRQSRAKANALKQERQQNRLKESLQAQGLNSTRHIFQQKREEEAKRKQEEFKERQKAKRVEIVEKILLEKQMLMSKKTQQAPTPKPRTPHTILSPGRIRRKLLYYLDTRTPPGTESEITLRNVSLSSGSSSESEYQEDPVQKELLNLSLPDSLEEPEFCGLWDQNYKFPSNDKKVLSPTVAKQDKPTVVSSKLSVTSKKLGAKEVKGPSFSSKPEVILFKDFEVGETYKKKVILTNISYITNHCKLLGISAQLQDFILINFQPPGPLSTGMSCEMHVTFHPSINEEVEGEVQFSSATDYFSVPVRCTIKRCDLEVDSQFIDFGLHVVGQTVLRTITLTNKGALATYFCLDITMPVTETHQVQMPSQVSASTCQDNFTQPVTSITTCDDVTKSATSMATRELQQTDHVSEMSTVSQKCQQERRDTETCVSSSVDAPIEEDPSDCCDITIGNVREGEIGPFESVKLELIFSPTVPGEVQLDLNMKFSDPTSNPIPIHVKGEGVGLPVWVVDPNIDMKICMFDHLYQNVVTLQSSTSTALKLTFDLCSAMRKHIEILPRTGFLQAQSSFTAHLKFVPRQSLPQDASKYFDHETGVLEVPMTVQVAGQVHPVIYTIQAIVTSSDMKFDQMEVDFGYCSIYQSVKSSVRLTNMSLLPQEFGFVAVPECVQVQPNDGFGTLLPQETLEIDVIFSASKAKPYRFQLSCKSAINRVFPLACRAMGVCPPLELSHYLIQFGSTAVGDHSTALLYLTYSQCGRKLSKQPACAEGRLFSFTPPRDSSFSISPAAGRLLPGERCLILVTFRPKLEDQDIREEALHLLNAKKLVEEEAKKVSDEEPKKESVVDIKAKKLSKSSKVETSEASKNVSPIETPPPENIEAGSQSFEEARTSLLHSFTPQYSEYTIPCFVSDGDPPEENRQAQPTWSPLNTLYLKLQCLAVQPPLVVVSNNIRNYVLDFQQITVGERVIKKVAVENISDESLQLRSSLLDVNGPFSLLNSLRVLSPGDKHILVLTFCPTLEKKFCETLEVHCQKMTLALTLRGEGVVPAITCSHSGGLLDFGCVLEKESISQVLKLQNSSEVTVGFKALLYSPLPSKTQDADERVALLLGGYTDSKIQPVVGTQNYNGLSVFSVVPVEGCIAARQSQDIVVTFHPDHPSVNYSDQLTIELVNKSKLCVLDLKGAASSHNTYLLGGDPLTIPVESLLPPLITSPLHPAVQSGEMEIPVLLTLRASYSMGTIKPAVRELEVGCIRTSKKGCEFFWDNLASLQQQGFSVEPSKSLVDAGTKRTITLTWTPQSGHKPNEVVQMCVPLTVKGDGTKVYNVTLMAFVSTAVD
ncbi:cilia- and flagella-associated protein 74 [Nerophis ophidion]|uniref:cilia- and flagella-associated protein 74 n=1 Tax=Nerophis ophidion TaxID=159077 RepID=UPI002ADFE086|nr:cilia- and flagella-associated protein 74 [Nerophis ophidion]